MNTEYKLKYFSDAINKEVESRKRTISHEQTLHANDEITAAVKSAADESNAQNLAQFAYIQKVMNKRISTAQTESRRTIATLRERLMAQLFDKIKEELIAFMKSDKYESYLINSIIAAQEASSHPYAVINLTLDDIHLGEAIQKATNLTPHEGDANMLGGYKLITENKGKVLDCTFLTRLTQARQLFMQELAIDLHV